MQDKLKDCIISKVYKGEAQEFSDSEKSWESTPYNFYVDGDERKFTYWQSGQKRVPTEGMRIDLLKFDETTVEGTGKHDGRTFTNCKITALEWADDGAAPPQQTRSPQQESRTVQSTGDTRDLSFCLAYTKDLKVAHMEHQGGQDTFSEICKQVTDEAVSMWKAAFNGTNSKVDPVADPQPNMRSDSGGLEPLTDVPKGSFAVKVAVNKCPIDANKGDPVATIYCSSQCEQVKACEGFRDMMPEIARVADIPFP